MESIDINQNQPDVRIEVIDSPAAGKSPVSPRLTLCIMTSTLGGLLLGIGFVYARDVLDDRFRSPEELKRQLDTNVLAIVRQLPLNGKMGIEGLQVQTSPDSVESEAFRTLRTTLAFADADLNCVAVTSPEPGDGKTTVISNLGASFAQVGKRTLMIDADLRRPGLSKHFEMKGHPGTVRRTAFDRSIGKRLQSTGPKFWQQAVGRSAQWGSAARSYGITGE